MNADLQRLEEKVDKLTDAVTRLILVEERQTAQGVRIGTLEQTVLVLDNKIGSVKDKVSKYSYMAVGAAGVVAFLWSTFMGVVKTIQ